MSLENFYTLRNNFIIIGLTGRMGGGSNDVCNFLTRQENPFINSPTNTFTIPENLHINERQKFNICKNLLTDSTTPWIPYKVIKYRDVLLLFIIAQIYEDHGKNIDSIDETIIQNLFIKIFDPIRTITPRIGQENSTGKIIKKVLCPFFNQKLEVIIEIIKIFKIESNIINLDSQNKNEELCKFFYSGFSQFSDDFYNIIDQNQPIARQLLLQDISCNLRSNGTIFFQATGINDKNIYIVSKVIKDIIKITKIVEGSCKLVIDSLKNSLEINYFRERYSGFYLLSSNKDSDETEEYLETKITNLKKFEKSKIEEIVSGLKYLDKEHYKINNFKRGDFTSIDLENCIQKADYYLFHFKRYSKISYESKKFEYLPFELQMLKFLALVNKPGLVTPSAIERNMQLAFSSKYNSGCISRQVGAVITDENYSLKSVGWNEVPQGQTPCSLRSLKEFSENVERQEVYTDYEKNGGNYNNKTFREKVNEVLINTYENKDDYFKNMQGHNCPFCFKEFHNSFEGENNQVHTRSLHAEENAMLQISKRGGQPLNGGNLFTTASPCELCSKKAFQLGIKNIFYIDPYPGIAVQQVIGAGNNSKNNPKLYIYQGAVGRGYFKLYEPYMSIKDETRIRMNLKLKREFKIDDLKNMLKDHISKEAKIKLDKLLKNSTDPKSDFLKALERGLE